MKALLLLFLPLYSFSADIALSHIPGETITRPWYSLDYNEEHEVANWVGYTLEASQLRNCTGRYNSFSSDPLISTGSAVASDYRNSGFDRGHLVPAGDMKFAKEAMKDTFYLSNITPQPASFNRGQWGSLENLIRAWAKKYGKIWIVTGPILKDDLDWIGNQNEISIPEEYYKVILRKENKSIKGIAFLIPTSPSFSDLHLYTVSIDVVEDITKINFFTFLSAKEEREAEGKFNVSEWDFTARFDYSPCETSAVQ